MSKIEDALEKALKLRQPDTAPSAKNIGTLSTEAPLDVKNPHIVTLTELGSPIAEEYRRLKSMLIRETKADFLNTIMVTSAVEGEGKTITSINLAVTLAQEIDCNILLVDADLRKPMVCEYLGIDYEYGLADYIRGDVDLSEVLIRTGRENLVVLPAGKVPENPAELMSSEKMKNLVTELKQRYMDRYIIIDTPPILSFAEAISIGSLVDGIVFVIKEGRVQKKSIDNALGLLKDLNVLGLVFNSVSLVNREGYPDRYSYYGYKNKEK